jgi:2,3-bisphosphoglycerate-dependent phosphoglycerate mutase
MKITISVVLSTIVFACAGSFEIRAQSTKTIILVRHAEKDASPTADKTDPVLSDLGNQRAQRFLEMAKRYKPGAIYSTAFKRTRSTVEPLAKHRKLEIKTYDPRKHADLVNEIMQSKTKRFVVVGHSNTIPVLANLIAKKELFKNLDDSEYTVIWLIRLKNGKPAKLELIDF